ncbi:MAG TPA: cupin domain-containing protein [Candidatus Eisenbacteria bacterium]|nr:cupin domain-containing protein [Candidatus Eisenbacteria bacterium]
MAATKTDVTAGEDHVYLSAGELEWERAAEPPGELKRLFTDPEDGMETRLVRYHAGDETGGEPGLLGREVIVLEGDFEVGGLHLGVGDFHRASGATVTGRTETGCVLFSVREVARDAGTGEAPDVGTLDEAVTIRAADGPWTELGPGTRAKRLTQDSVHSCEISIVRMDASAMFPPHRHPGAEELLVLVGDCSCQGRRLGPGDYTRSAAGTEHEENRSEQGAEIIMVRHGVG